MQDLQSRYLRILEGLRAPGISIAWTHGDEPVETCAAGTACIGTARNVRVDTTFPWFSATKLFTATAVLELVASGKVALDARISEHIDDLPLGEASGLTPRQLLSHTSGLANPMPLRWVHLATEPAPDLESMTARLLARHGRLRFDPGTRYAYSNLGYLVLGVLIQRATGLRFEEYVQREVLDPLGAARSGFDLPPDAACGYFRTWSAMGLAARLLLRRKLIGPSRGRLTELNPFLLDGAPYGGLVGPANELVLLGRMMVSAGSDRHLLPESMARLALTPARSTSGDDLPMGLGWHLGTRDGEPYAYHFGGGAGFRSELRIYPRLRFAVAVIANETTFDTTPVTSITPE